MDTLELGTTSDGCTIGLPLRFANRHGVVTGATGTGKTVTLQRMAEQFSAAGVPVFAADVKGDLSGIATAAPAVFWDVFGRKGHPIRTSVQEIGATMMARMLGLNEVQAGALAVLFARLFRSLDALVGGDDRVAAAWLRNHNTALSGEPLLLIQTVPGLVNVIHYLDARRALV